MAPPVRVCSSIMPDPEHVPPRDIVVVAASAGGVEALLNLVSGLPEGIQSAVFTLLHVPDNGTSVLHRILGRRSLVPVVAAVECQPIESGRVVVAPPGRHLALDPGFARLLSGPRENGHRPAADVLFRSAAAAYGARVIGVVMSGADDDGAAGLVAIKRAGGLAVVQDPKEALHSRMPESALSAVKVDHCLPVHEIANLIAALAPAQSLLGKDSAVPEPKRHKTPEKGVPAIEKGYQDGEPAVYTCPECHGTLWEIDDGDVVRFRCRVGHAYTAEHLLAGQEQEVESAVCMAIRTLEEKAQLTGNLGARARKRGLRHVAKRFEESSDEAGQAAETLRELLLSGHAGVLNAGGEVVTAEGATIGT